MINPQLINAFVECLLELEDLVLVSNRSEEEHKEYKDLLNSLGNLFTRMVLEVKNEEK